MITAAAEKDGVLVLVLEGNLDISKQSKLKEELQKQIALSSNKQVLVDLRKVAFVDSACLGILIGLARQVRKDGGDIRLAGLNDEVMAIFQMTRLDKVFQIFTANDQGISSYQSS